MTTSVIYGAPLADRGTITEFEVYATDSEGNILFCSGLGVGTQLNGTQGFRAGCIYLNVADGDNAMYWNHADSASATFTLKVTSS